LPGYLLDDLLVDELEPEFARHDRTKLFSA
jgi:hypothetical protein